MNKTNFTEYLYITKKGIDHELKEYDDYHWLLGSFDWLSLLRIKFIEKWESYQPVYGKTEFVIVRENNILWKGKTKQAGVKEMLRLEKELTKQGVEIRKRAGRAN